MLSLYVIAVVETYKPLPELASKEPGLNVILLPAKIPRLLSPLVPILPELPPNIIPGVLKADVPFPTTIKGPVIVSPVILTYLSSWLWLLKDILVPFHCNVLFAEANFPIAPSELLKNAIPAVVPEIALMHRWFPTL
nr:MAG TPA: hypothetical protein [Bacteriophage sp.]